MKSIFNTSNYYIIRAPLFPISIYNNYLKHEGIDYSSFFNHPIIEETIMTTTYQLYKSLTNISFDSESKKARNAKQSFLKYLIRMSTRGTPYGLLSGISLGQFDDKTNIQISDDINEYDKHVKIDGSWLCKLIRFLESHYKYYKDSFVIWNERNYIINQRIYLDNQTCLIQENNHEIISIKYNDILKCIKESLSENITFKDLLKLISKTFSINDEKEIKNFIQNLLDKEIIFTSLRTALNKEHPLAYLLYFYGEVNDDFIKSLQFVHYEMMRYQNMKVGEGKETFLRIRKLMSDLFKAKEYIQIDTRIQTKNNCLSNRLAENVSEAAYLLWLISPNDLGTSTIHEFHYDFMEKYGFEQIVNLKELLSDINGMGYPNNENKPIKNDIPFLKEKYYYAISHNKEIEITENELLDLEKKNTISLKRAPLTSEIYSEFYYGNTIKGYDEFLVISPIVSSYNAGATMGRFSQEFEKDLRSQLDEEINEQYIEYSKENNTEVIHINEIPKYARNLNINHSGSTKLSELELDMPYSSIVLDELYVGSTFDKLYLFSKNLNSRVIFITHSMLNFVLCSDLYRFLREVSLGNTKFIQPIKDNGIDGFNYCPRIRYKNVILKPATWKLNKDMFTHCEKEKWINQFHEIQLFYDIPNDVTMTFGDNRLTINLSNHAHISILKKEIEKQGRVSLLENFIQDANNDRVIEIVTPIYRKVKSNEKRITIPKNIYKQSKSKRDWLSIHLFIDENYQNDFTIQFILPCLRELLDNSKLEKFFFIKYKENEHFIKLRLLNKNNDSAQLYNYILQWKQQWLDKSELSHFAIVDYQPEIYRYGGSETIEIVEDYFMYDSWLAIHIINQTFKYPKAFVVAISIIFLLNELEISQEEINEIRSNNVEDLYRNNEIREYKNELVKLTNPKDNYRYLHEKLPNLHHILCQNYNEIEKLKVALGKDLSTPRTHIIGSLIHMRCNRIFGVNRNKEKFVLSIFNEIEKTKKYWCGEAVNEEC
ncbi:enterotoxin [Staphylococcus sp. HMSC036D05]|uniref:lantibiotic dehydratase n=1 Tax=Staphylococcus sp. HMSC036D05 TaxID=1715059 RepID=UPI0008A9F137|nr:lantibiotic dehydratase [Staphylococcus sp. HMSC036D05]OHO72012.1 enterotoxin [Staphylococcus sp. HMSC036D05]